MEKRALTMRDYIVMAVGLVVIVCMFLNWFPVDLDLGVIEIDEVFGNINAFTLSKTLDEIEEHLGVWMFALPEEYGNLKAQGTALGILGVCTVIAYISVIVLNVLGKKKYVNAATLLAGVCAVITYYIFYSIASDFYNVYSATTVLAESPCTMVLLGGIATIACANPVAEVIAHMVTNIVDGFIAAIINIVNFIVEWVKLIANNIGYVVSDIVGGIAGVAFGSWLSNMTDSTLIAVIGGLIAAGVVAIACMTIVCRVILHSKESIFA